MNFELLQVFFASNLAKAMAVAGTFGVATQAAYALLPAGKKDSLALWLMGAKTSQNWSRSFCDLFDAIFGENHLSAKCVLRSFLASLIAVMMSWFFLGSIGNFKLRADATLGLGQVLLIGFVINLLADYISLLETRYLLNLLHRHQAVWVQLAVLLVDLVLSGAIIFAAIWVYIRSPLYQGDIHSFAEVLGAFSIFSVFFYSTFLTSVWTWGFILSTWFLRLFTATPLARLIDEKNADKWLVLVGSAVVLVAALGLAVPLQSGADGVSRADRMLCSAFPGVVCNRVAELTEDEQVKLGLIMQACAGGVTQQCLDRANKNYEVNNSHAARLWDVACQGGDARGCTNLGFMYESGLGVDPDAARAVELFTQGCEGGNALGCTNLGFMYESGLGVDPDAARAVELFTQGCEGGNALGCTNLGSMYRQGLGVDPDPARAVELYTQGCEGGDALGCTNLGVMYINGLGVEPDVGRAVTLYRQGCEGGSVEGCYNLGLMFENGLGVEPDAARAVEFYTQACEGGNARGCYNSGLAHEFGDSVAVDLTAAVEFYTKACELGQKEGCGRADDLAATTSP